MPVPAVVELEALLAPLEGENPAGESLRYEGTYDQIKEARRADEALEQGAWQRDLKVADWPKVIQYATEALTSKTRDLQIAAWLTEALTRNERADRLAGLRDGLQLMRGLMERFWDHFYPEIDPEDDEGPLTARANVIADIEARLGLALREVPLTRGDRGQGISYLQWEESRQFDIPDNLDALPYEEQEKARELKARAETENRVTSDMWRKSYQASPRAFYEERFELISECRDAAKALDQYMDEMFRHETPGIKTLEKALDDVATLLEKLVKEKRIAEPTPEELAAASGGEEEEAVTGADDVVTVSASGTKGPIRSRQDALKRLSEVADYFRRTEPHSPVAYLVLRAVRWGEMPLENWLNEVVKDSSVLEQLRETLGIMSDSE